MSACTTPASGLSGAQCQGLVGPGVVRYGEIGTGQRQDGVAQVGPGEVADCGIAGANLLRQGGLGGAADHQHGCARARELRGDVGEACGGPAF